MMRRLQTSRRTTGKGSELERTYESPALPLSYAALAQYSMAVF